MKSVEFGKWLYLIGDGLKKTTTTDTRVCVVEKSDDLSFLEQ